MHENLRGRARVSALWIDTVRVEVRDDAYAELCRIAGEHRARNEGRTVGQVEGVSEARRLYRAFGIDPTSTRPSSEALLKRSLQGKELYHINNVVDVGNAVSLATLLPLGLYDRSKIVGDEVWVREGLPGEEYAGIRKGMVHLEGRLCVADLEGAFGSPTSDSHRTSIDVSTNELLVVVFAPAEGELSRLEDAGQRLADAFARHAGGITVKSSLL